MPRGSKGPPSPKHKHTEAYTPHSYPLLHPSPAPSPAVYDPANFFFRPPLRTPSPSSSPSSSSEPHNNIMSANGKAKGKIPLHKKKKPGPKPAIAADYDAPSADESSPPSSSPSSPKGGAGDPSLKIKIKLGPAPTPPLLRILGLEAFLELRGYLQPFLHHGEWSEADLRSLRTHVEAARSTVHDIGASVAQQVEALDAWRAAAPKEGGRRKGDIPKPKERKRGHDEFKGDSPYSDESEDDDVDVDVEGDVDVVAIDSADDSKAEGGHKRGTYSKRGGAGGQNNKMATMIRRRNMRRHAKFKARGAAAAAAGAGGRRHKSPVSSPSPTFEGDEYDAGGYANEGFGDEEDEEGANAAAPLGHNAFWQALEAYFRPIVEADLQYIAPKAENPDESIWKVPPLGPHYVQVWASEDGEDKKLLSGLNPVRSSIRIAASRAEDDDEDPIVGDLTRRILASLIEENLVVSRPSSPLSASHSASMEDDDPTNPSSIPHIPTTNYNRQAMLSLEERIRLELRSIGLLDDAEDGDSSEREDDEVCAELRNLHNSLKEQIAINNDRKAKLMAIVRPKMAQQEAERKQKLVNQQTEKNFQKLMQRKKKRGGRRGALPVSLPEYG